jgi:hypothetical protein
MKTELFSWKYLQATLPIQHLKALRWFFDHTGKVEGWLAPLSDGTLLASKAKGIYKPKWSKYALSVRESLKGPYPDVKPKKRKDGTWFYRYYQEQKELSARDKLFTNKALMECWKDRVPVGVFWQVSSKPNVKYRVLGLALVSSWEAGYFYLEGFSPSGRVHDSGSAGQLLSIVTQLEADSQSKSFEPSNLTDARERIAASIVQRRGQREFRNKLIVAYDRKCAISGCDALEALEAVHIVPYLGPKTNHVTNGLLLRADLHTLFDLGLISIHPAEMVVVLSPKLKDTFYSTLAGQKLHFPDREEWKPNKEALEQHYFVADL